MSLIAAAFAASLMAAPQRRLPPIPPPSGERRLPPPPPPRPEPMGAFIASLDRDSDGMVSREELTSGIAASFAPFDRARRGSIGYIEMGDWAARWLGDRHARPSPFETDRDGDGRINLAELQLRFHAIFTRADLDSNGKLGANEIATIVKEPASGVIRDDPRGSRDAPPR